jgi:hypothetical protein
MHTHREEDQLTSDDLLREVAAVLAAGLLRLQDRPDPAQHLAPEKPSESGPDGLEVPGQTSVSVQAG